MISDEAVDTTFALAKKYARMRVDMKEVPCYVAVEVQRGYVARTGMSIMKIISDVGGAARRFPTYLECFDEVFLDDLPIDEDFVESDVKGGKRKEQFKAPSGPFPDTRAVATRLDPLSSLFTSKYQNPPKRPRPEPTAAQDRTPEEIPRRHFGPEVPEVKCAKTERRQVAPGFAQVLEKR